MAIRLQRFKPWGKRPVTRKPRTTSILLLVSALCLDDLMLVIKLVEEHRLFGALVTVAVPILGVVGWLAWHYGALPSTAKHEAKRGKRDVGVAATRGDPGPDGAGPGHGRHGR
jgi:hypothetical protein